MPPLPEYRPKQLALGPLESEVLDILWQQGSSTVKAIHDQILADPDRELAYATVTTVLQRLLQKGWVSCDRQQRTFIWHPCLSREQARSVLAHDKLQQFLSVGNPDVVAAFADSLDTDSIDQLQAIAARLKVARERRDPE
ncbi:MAG: BlaI/MecI/CopY family transcriptional regulator [Cyanophyceae cyanobacterium]|jgi:predicted transcriptional regulator